MSLPLFDLLNLTYRSLGRNPLRSLLTTLGVFMGVVAVSATLQVRSISRAVISRQLAQRDAPHVTLGLRRRLGNRSNTRLVLEDAEYLGQRLAGLRATSAIDWLGSAETIFQGEVTFAARVAVSPDFLQTRGKPMVAGRFFTSADFENFRPVVVIDQFLANQLFGQQSPVGQRIYVRQRPYVVVGVVMTEITTGGAPPEGQLFIPLSFARSLTGNRSIDAIQLRPTQLEDLETITKQAERLLGQRYPGQHVWSHNNVEDILIQQQTLELASQGLTVVGLISLLIGGVGIANIMIASVTERTAEIGLCRALGATQLNILTQLTLEVAILSLVGGTTAILVVHGLTLTVSEKFDLPYKFESSTAVLAIGSALLVGVGSGFLPAWRASQLDPVKALRDS